jgi:hydroxymethylbilane synthase
VSAARVVIGSRASTLALIQAETVAGLLRAAHPALDVTIEKITTTGDRIVDAPLSRIGDKGLFTKELESALLDGRIDCAVHSAKDLPTTLPAGCAVGAFTRREDPRDVFVAAAGAPAAHGPGTLPRGARVGSSSLRRRSQLLALRPDLELVDLRGNVETRLRKVAQQGLDGTVLAAAGLARLGRAELASFAFSFDQMLPAVGQGALAVETRAGDERIAALVACLHDGPTALAVRAERALLGALEGGCQIPIGAHAELRGATHGGEAAPRGGATAGSAASGSAVAAAEGAPFASAELLLRAFVGSLDGTVTVRDSLAGPAAEPEALGRALAERLRAAGAERILAALRGADGVVPGSAR